MRAFFHSAPWGSEKHRIGPWIEKWWIYAGCFRWPLLLIVAACLLDKLIYYGLLPLGGVLEGEGDFVAARVDLARGQGEAALLKIRTALMHSRENVSFWKLAAQIEAERGSGDQSYCWSQIDRLAPGSSATEMQLAVTAWREGRFDLASQALGEMAPADREGVAFFRVEAQTSEALGQREQAQAYFIRLEHAQPRDRDSLLALAQWHAKSPEAATRARAAHELEGLLRDPEVALPAYRGLIDLAVGRGDFAGAEKWSDALLRRSGVTMEDRVRRLDIAEGLSPALLDWTLAGMMQVDRPGEIAPVCDWMTAHGRAEAALIWIRTQPEEIQDDPVIGVARADCLAALGMWDHLRADQVADSWPGREPMRLLILARACRMLQDEDGARAAWEQALLACRNYEDYLGLLEGVKRMESRDPLPAWAEEQTELLLQVVNRYPAEPWAVSALLRDAFARHDSLRVEQMERKLTLLEPGDAEASARYALTRLLRGTQIGQASATLDRLARETPNDPVVATAEGYDLYRQGRFADALAAIGGMSPQELAAPERAVYLGALLASAGPIERARDHLQAAATWPDLSDEEKALAERARQNLDYREAMAELLSRPAGPDAAAMASRFQEAGGIFLVGQSVAFSRAGATVEAARLLAAVDVTSLDPAGLTIYLGGVLELDGQSARAGPCLTLAPDLPFAPSAENAAKLSMPGGRCRRRRTIPRNWPACSPLIVVSMRMKRTRRFGGAMRRAKSS